MSKKLTIVPYAIDGEELKRGRTSIAADASKADIAEKVRKAAARAGKRTDRVVVDNEDTYNVDGTIRSTTRDTNAPAKTGTKLLTIRDGKPDYRKQPRSEARVIDQIIELLHEAGPRWDEEAQDWRDDEDGWEVGELAYSLNQVTGRHELGLVATIKTQISRLRKDGYNVVRTYKEGDNGGKASHYRIYKAEGK